MILFEERKEIEDKLIFMLFNDQAWEVRRNAIRVLKRYKSERSIRSVNEAALSDVNPIVRWIGKRDLIGEKTDVANLQLITMGKGTSITKVNDVQKLLDDSLSNSIDKIMVEDDIQKSVGSLLGSTEVRDQLSGLVFAHKFHDYINFEYIEMFLLINLLT